MQKPSLTQNTAFQLISRLDERAGCDPDFDAQLDDLEREFAELRLTFATEA